MQYSDQTVAEQLAARLRRARAYQLFARRLGPGDLVHVSVCAFTIGGRPIQREAVAEDLEDALLAVLALVDAAVQCDEPFEPAEPEDLNRPGHRQRGGYRAPVRFEPEPEHFPGTEPKTEEARERQARRVALERARRLGSITVSELLGALGRESSSGRMVADITAMCRRVLEQLVDEGELTKSPNRDEYHCTPEAS